MKKAVIGLGFGDEGKGTTVDYLCRNSKRPESVLVVRYSGGQQAGHTVVTPEGKRHVFSNFGSGTLSGSATYWSKFCTVDPVGMTRELEDLLKISTPTIIVDTDAPVTTPYEIWKDSSKNENMTCGVGVGETFKREENFHSLTFGDLFHPIAMNEKIELIREYYEFNHRNDLQTQEHWSNFMESVEKITSCPYIQCSNDHGKTFSQYSGIIFESSQGLLLDQHYGFFPYVTRSNTGTKNILEMTDPRDLSLYLVTRAYQTRHGKGMMTNTALPHNIVEDPNETNVENQFQGKFRISLLDLDLLKYSLSKDFHIRNCPVEQKTLVVTCLDHVRNEWRFTENGKIHACSSEDEFVETVRKKLGFQKCMTNDSPFSKNFISR